MTRGLIWAVLAGGLIVPTALAATSPLLAWRDPVYIVAGFCGIIGLWLLLVQPVLAGGYLGLRRGRKIHQIVGALLIMAVLGHVVGLWITSPPDVVDALLLRSATPFSLWGVIAMWGVFATALLAVLRQRLKPRHWRMGHTGLGIAIVEGSVAHALLIEGTMELWSKLALCLLVIAATFKVVQSRRAFAKRKPA